MHINKENLLTLTKTYYSQAITDLDIILKNYTEIWDSNDILNNLNRVFWKEYLVDKINILEYIEKLKHNKESLELIDISELTVDLPEYFLDEKTSKIIDLIKKSYKEINYLWKYYKKLFKNNSETQKILEIKEKIDKIEKNISKNLENFKIFSKKYNNFLLSKKIEKNLTKWFFWFWVKNYKMSLLIVLVIILLWTFSLFTIPKESSPEIDLWIIAISTRYDWASPEDVDNLITSKIENNIEDITWISKMTSTSWNGYASTTLQLKNWVDIDEVKQEVIDKVDWIALPTWAEDPDVISIETDNKLMFQLIVYWDEDDFSNYHLLNKAQIIKSRLEWTPGITSIDIWKWVEDGSVQVSLWWDEDSLFDIELNIDRKKAEEIGLSMYQIATIIKSNNSDQPLGNFNLWNLSYDYRISWELEDIQDLKDVIIRSSGNSSLRLWDISEIKKVEKDKRIKKYWKFDKVWYNYVSLNINKSEWQNIFFAAKSAKNSIKELFEEYQFDWLDYSYSMDLSDILIEDYKSLGSNALTTLVLVFITLLFFVGIKEAVISAIILPLTFLVTFTVLNVLGLTLNFLTNFSLILTLWIAIDTIIVVIEWASHNTHMWYNPKNAVLLAIRDYKTSLMAWTATTLVAFFPMMFLPGIMWKFLAYIPITIFATLIAWLTLSLTILGAVFFVLSRPKKHYSPDENSEKYMRHEEKALLNQEREWKTIKEDKTGFSIWKIPWMIFISLWILFFFFSTKSVLIIPGWLLILYAYIYKEKLLKYIANIYEEKISNILYSNIKRKVVIILPIFCLILTFVFFGEKLVKNFQLFSSGDNDYLYINISSKNWTKKEVMSKYTKNIDEILKEIKEIDSYTTLVSWSNINTTINLQKKAYRNDNDLRTVFEVKEFIEEKILPLKENWLDVALDIPSDGPPGGQAVWVNLIAYNSKDFKKLIEVSKDFENYLNSTTWYANITNSSTQTPWQFIFRINRAKLALLGITSNDIFSEIYFALNGISAWTIAWDYTDDEIVLKYNDLNDEVTPDKLLSLSILTQAWKIKLSSILDYNLENSVASISREDGSISVKVSAWVEKWSPTLELQNKLVAFAEAYDFPDNITFKSGWENDENADLLAAVWISFLVAIIFIFTILVLQFNSYIQPLIIMYSIVLSLIWVNIWLALTWNAYSMSFGIWFISLTWIVVNDAILLLSTINSNLKKWLVWYTAIIQAWKSRLEPIMVTTLTTCFWLLPVAMQDEFWAWIGYTVVFWLFTWTFFTIFVIPIIYYEIILHKKNKKNSKKNILKF